MVPDVQSIREYQNFPNSYLLFTKISMRLCISHSLCSAVHNYDSLCMRSSRSPIMLSILLVISPLRIVVRCLRFTAAFWAVERAAPRCAGYQVSDTLLAVVVEARQHSGLLEMLLANWTCQFVVQLLKAHGEQVTTALRHFFQRRVTSCFDRLKGTSIPACLCSAIQLSDYYST